MPLPANFIRPLLATFAVFLGSAWCTAATTAAPGVVIESFTAGGHDQNLRLQPTKTYAERYDRGRFDQSYEPVRLPVTAQALDFRIAPNPAAPNETVRIQYQLLGWDEDWREVDGLMWLSVRFLDDKGRRISSESLPRSGQSSGWTGDPTTSSFHVRSETITPPPRARQLQIYLAAGGPRTMGIWMVKGFRVVALPSESQQERLLLNTRIDRGDELHEPRGVPADWRREGTNASIAQVFTLPGREGGASDHALALIDNDARSTGRWVATGQNLVEVHPGIPVRIEIEEAFSVGAGGPYTCSYHKLPTGSYRFRAIPVDEFGVQSGGGIELPIILVPPFYESWWFWTIVGLGTVAGVAGGVRYATRKRMQHKLEQSERRRSIETERMRIAQDIHDDMGARLTQICLASGLALRHTPPGSAAIEELRRLDRAAREVVVALDEIVWAVNPAQDTLEGLGNYISQYVTEITAESGLRCRLEIPTLLPARVISSGARHHLLMAVKEALNNALKHAGATEVRVQLEFTTPTVTVTISDDGAGFDRECAPAGNGITNMEGRLRDVGGSCTIRSAPGEGSTVTFTLPLGPVV